MAERDILNKFVMILKDRFKGKITRIILFGSRAKGVNRPDSDYDLAVILRKKNHIIINQIYDEVLTFLLRYAVDLSLKIYSEENFQKETALPTPFMEEIMTRGVELWPHT